MTIQAVSIKATGVAQVRGDLARDSRTRIPELHAHGVPTWRAVP